MWSAESARRIRRGRPEEGTPLGGRGVPRLVQPVSQAAGALRKLEHTFLALNHLAAAIITLRKIMLPVNIIYG